ncbi:MAG: hypothetical protein KBG20_19265 [Caldilineaceae bacterium]|nr:hypothetical protein [Caldilineaceae bacterium]MBP8125105.1 hypothetical protein [Caldilineaceae bacterium]MBP9074456.1 hypothetical protein [Caldilineaceae bacterium]
MNTDLLETVQTAQRALDPQFKALRAATGALNQAVKLAAEERADALAMQKSLAKLEQAGQDVTDPAFAQAVADFAAVTRQALDDLAFHFAHDLKEVFEQRGETVEGRPPTLVVGALVLQIDIAARKAQWLYGKEALTKPIPLSINTIVKVYDQQRKAIVDRKIDVTGFLAELHTAWNELLAKRSQRPAGGRINLIELYSQVVMNRQIPRFWNAPSRSTFKDYERVYFVRDLVLAHDAPGLTVDGRTAHLRLGVATKNQAESAARSIWIPQSALDGDYYASLWFE